MWKSKVKEVTSILCSSLFTLFYLSLTRNRLPLGELWTHFDSLTGTFQAFGLCVCVCWSPFAYSDSMVTATRRSGSFTAWSLLPCAVMSGPPPQGSVSLRPSRCYAVLESVSFQDWCLFYTTLETLTSCCYGLRPYRWALIHLYGHKTVILRSKGILRVEIVVFALYWDSRFVAYTV